MDPILQQLHRYYQQQQQPRPYGAEGKLLTHSASQGVFSPWWLKLRATLQREVAHNTQVANKQVSRAND
jgi:hypothetical protein